MSKTKLRIHTWPEKILKKKCELVRSVDDEIRTHIEDMLALMRISGGVGLAANQAGLDLSLVVIEFEGRIFKLVNPRIVKSEGAVSFLEGCLSFPGLELEVNRKNRVWVSALDDSGKALDLELEGFLAVVFQHEIDHINGVTFIDRVSFWQRLKAFPQLKMIVRRTKNRLSKQEKKH